MKHDTPAFFAGQTVTIRAALPNAIGDLHEFHVEDYWDRVSGQSWMVSEGNFAALGYAMRSAFAGLPLDDEVLYGKVDGLGYLVHTSEVLD